MTEAAKFFNDFGDLLLQKVEMNFIAQIISFNSGEYRATIRPMLFTNNESGNGQVVNVPDIYNVLWNGSEASSISTRRVISSR